MACIFGLMIDLTCTAWIVLVLRPWWLMAAAAAVAPPVLWELARRRGRRIPRFSVVIQCVALVAAAGALAGVSLPLGPKAFKPCLLFRDVSGSVRGQSDTELRWPDSLEHKTYVFAAGVWPYGGDVDANGTWAGAALRFAASEAPNVSGIVIHTDGQFTDDWATAAKQLGRSGADVMIVPMASPPPEVRIVDVSARRRGGGERVDVTVFLASNAPRKRRITVRRLGAAGPLLDEERLMVGAATIRLTDTLSQDQAAEYHVELAPADMFAENDSATALVLPTSHQVAVVSREAAGGKVMTMLAGMGVAVDWLLLADVPATEVGWSRYAGVVVVDATGMLLSLAQRKGLAGYVRGGGGLVLIGACPHRTAADRDDPLSQVAALLANPYERRPMKVTVVLDASGSMSPHGTQQAKFDIAANAVMALKRHLTPSDSLAVMTFSDTPRDIYDSGNGGIDFSALHDALGKVQPGGPTHVGEALNRAARRPKSPGRTELVILLSDLVTEPFDAGAIAKLFKNSDKKLAIVATVPPGTDTSKVTDLTNLAMRLGVTPRRSEDLRGLAEIFAAFLSEHRGPAVRRGGPFAVTPVGKPFDAEVEGIESLSSYVLSAPQLRADVLMRVADDGKTEPLLASRRVGLGRSVTLSAGMAGQDNAAWQASSRVAGLVRAAAQWCLRRSPSERYTGQAVEERGKLVFRFQALDPEAGAINLLTLALRVESVTPAPDIRDVPLLQVAPGRYEASLDMPAEGFLLMVREVDKGDLWQRAYGRSVPVEFRAIGANGPNLRRLAGLTGGRIVLAGDVGDVTGQWDRRRYTDIWPVLAGLAMLLVLTDWVATRTWKRWT